MFGDGREPTEMSARRVSLGRRLAFGERGKQGGYDDIVQHPEEKYEFAPQNICARLCGVSALCGGTAPRGEGRRFMCVICFFLFFFPSERLPHSPSSNAPLTTVHVG